MVSKRLQELSSNKNEFESTKVGEQIREFFWGGCQPALLTMKTSLNRGVKEF